MLGKLKNFLQSSVFEILFSKNPMQVVKIPAAAVPGVSNKLMERIQERRSKLPKDNNIKDLYGRSKNKGISK